MPRGSSTKIDGIACSWIKGEDGKPIACLLRVRDVTGKYLGKRFPIVSFAKDGTPQRPTEGMRWAKGMLREFTAGDATAGGLSILAMGLAYVGELKASGRNAVYAKHIELVARALDHAGISDLKADWFRPKFLKWLTDLEANWWEAVSDPKAKDAEGRFKFRRRLATSVSSSTRNKILREVRSVVNYAMELPNRPLRFDPTAGIRKFAEDADLKALFTVTELRQMVSQEHAADAWWLPCCLLVYTGCRAQEAMHLRWEWIDWENEIITLKIRPEFAIKGARERLISLQPELRDILKPLAKPHGWIVEDAPMRSNGSMSNRKRTFAAHPDYTPALHWYLKRIGIEPGDRTAHSTRHCFITLQLAMGMPEYQVMATVGHRQIGTTLGYAVQRQQYEKEVKGWPRGEMRLMPDKQEHQTGVKG